MKFDYQIKIGMAEYAFTIYHFSNYLNFCPLVIILILTLVPSQFHAPPDLRRGFTKMHLIMWWILFPFLGMHTYFPLTYGESIHLEYQDNKFSTLTLQIKHGCPWYLQNLLWVMNLASQFLLESLFEYVDPLWPTVLTPLENCY
jgi:putative copper export protein